MREKLEALLEELKEEGIKGRSSSKSHLSSALLDWRWESLWDNPEQAMILNFEDKGYAFIYFTKRKPFYCTLRHLFVLEKFRGEGVGRKLMAMMGDEMKKRGCDTLRFFADLPSVGFYESLGYTWHGKSKSGLPFFYGNFGGGLIDLPKGQQKYKHTEM